MDGQGEYVISGEGAGEVMDMITAMAAYLEGPGFPGFLAWLGRQLAGADPAPDAAAVRGNLARLQALIGAA